jgi:hypothetical protein
LIQAAPELTKSFLLTKEKPNFVPKAILERKKKEHEGIEKQQIASMIENEIVQEEEEKAIVKKAETKASAYSIPRPDIGLDEDDDDFAD